MTFSEPQVQCIRVTGYKIRRPARDPYMRYYVLCRMQHVYVYMYVLVIFSLLASMSCEIMETSLCLHFSCHLQVSCNIHNKHMLSLCIVELNLHGIFTND